MLLRWWRSLDSGGHHRRINIAQILFLGQSKRRLPLQILQYMEETQISLCEKCIIRGPVVVAATTRTTTTHIFP
jgi:hypothetical protein